ncbi:MAG TPA: tetratricopeptide repeat protein [Terriglobales bacterium]|nr:tetratricopeptide repeat protein [Terriglobales bacterium]
MKRLLFAFLSLVVSVPLFAADSALNLLNAGRADEAIKVLNGQVSANPQNAEAYNLLCRAYYFQEQFDPAIANCERAVQLDPKSSSYHMWLGRTYGDKADKAGPFAAFGLAKKAGAQFEQAVQLDPRNVPARTDLAEFYGSAPGMVGGGDDKARSIADETQKFDPVAAANMRAQLALSKKDYAASEHEAQTAVQLSGGTARALLELARIYGKQKHWDAMESTIQKAMSLPGKRPQDVFFAGELLIQNGRNLTGGIQYLRSYVAGPTDEQGPTFRAYYLIG